MTSRTTGRSPLFWARVAGVGYLAIIVTGIYAEFAVRGGLVVPGDAAATARNIAGAEFLYRSAIAAEFVMLVADVVVAVALYLVFRAVSPALAALAAAFRMVHAAVVGVNLLNVWVPLLLLGGAPWIGALGEAERQALVLLVLETHAYGYAVGLVFFGVYCALLGVLVVRSRYVPGLLGWLLGVAAAGYLADALARTLLSDYAAHADTLGMVVLVPAFVAELSFTVWLLVKGVAVPPEEAGA